MSKNMDEESKKNPKVFISYSWTTKDYENRIIGIAERLVEDGIDVVLDKWDLKEGHDTIAFMESMVLDEDVNKVLIFSDKKYKDKADCKEGGVGAESQILSPEVYNKVKQEKVIPIVMEFEESGDSCLPTFLKSLFYVDFSTSEKINSNWEQLLRIIYDKPALKKPQIGTPPSFVYDEESAFSSKLKSNKIPSNIILVDGGDNIIEIMINIVNNSQKFIYTLGGRSRNDLYLESLRTRVFEGNVRYVRVLTGKSIKHQLHKHLLELQDKAEIGYFEEEHYGNVLVNHDTTFIALPSPNSAILEKGLIAEDVNIASDYRAYIIELLGNSQKDININNLCELCNIKTVK